MYRPAWLAALAGAALLGPGLALSPVAQASEASQGLPPELALFGCSHAWSDRDKDGEADIDRTDVNVRSGPHATSDGGPCSVLFQLDRDDHVYYHCYTTTNSEGTWTHLRKRGGSQMGWVKDTFLPGGGSSERC
ncbi:MULTISPECIES: hypothetical protein [Streptomyces]|uniref:SH3 domain-containing protein n=1 Tax=Streptomyces luteosporeus TaxID=173856 RepID=A0ABP6GL84_9ACTN